MPLATSTKIFELKDVKISALTADPSTGSPTYGTSVDVPGILKLSLKPEMVKKDLEGDNQILDVYSKVKLIKWGIEHNKFPLDAIRLMMGGAVAAAGTTPNQTQTFTLSAGDRPGYIKIEGQSVYVDDGIGDVHFVLYKAKCDEAPSFDATDMNGDYAKVKAGGTAIALQCNSKMMDIIFNETAVAIV